MKYVRVAAAAAFLLLSASTAFAQDSVDLRPLWNGTSFISSFGVPNTATYGQTIHTQIPNVLQSFEFEVACDSPPTVRAHVYAWDTVNRHTLGASLYDSAPFVIPGNGLGSYSPVTVNTPAIAMPPGDYVLFLSVSQDYTGTQGCQWGALTTDAIYGGGQFVFENNSADTTQWAGGTWNFINEDLAFDVFFVGSVPTMPEWILMILIAATTLTAAWMLRRRSHRVQLSH